MCPSRPWKALIAHDTARSRALDVQFALRLHALSDTLAAGDEPAVPGDAPAALRP
jgi:hypothetical protein